MGYKSSRVSLQRPALVIVAVLLFAGAASAGAKEKVLYDFYFYGVCCAQGNLALDKQGNLYGVTTGGAQEGAGVYELTPSAKGQWTETTLYSFSNGEEGYNPESGLTFDKSGNLYGTTSQGGPAGNPGGVVFEMTPGSGGQWTYTVLHGFLYHSTTDGASPETPVVFDKQGNLYGTTLVGGTADAGTVFELQYANGSWTESILYSFPQGGNEGTQQPGNLTLDEKGNIYGTTVYGGKNDVGTVFKLTNSGGVWTETTLHDFTGYGDGSNPTGNLIVSNKGKIYGTTYAGGGGGCFNGCGVLYKLTPEAHSGWKEAVIHTFNNHGQYITSPALMFGRNGDMFGITEHGGKANGGTVFEFSPNWDGTWAESVLYTFMYSRSGYQPLSLTLGGAAKFYGTTLTGGTEKNDDGVVFQLTP
jgi:uncharacterized repeat protein (TIGR03803 family)